VNAHHDIVIVGGGVVGLTTAALLAQGPRRDSLRITLVDAAPRPAFSPDDDVALRVSAIATGSAELLARTGAWQRVEAARASPYTGMLVWDADATPGSTSTLSFDAAEFAVPQLGFIVENVLLQDALLAVLEETEVVQKFSTPIRAMTRPGRRFVVEFEDGSNVEADLVVGADGAHSFVRSAARIDSVEWRYEQTAFVTHLRPEQDHGGIARQRFLRRGPLGMLPLADGRISVVWSTTPQQAKAALDADDDELGRMLTDASDAALGRLTVAGQRGAFPLCARHARRYVLPGLALVGDAAHAIHPLAGQGANLGLQDAAELAAVVNTALGEGLNPGDLPALRRYERARKGADEMMMHLMTGLNALFATDSQVIGRIRRTGMRLFNRSGPLRERAVRVALGVG
jgi:2-octaprenylphenol hydroxylase